MNRHRPLLLALAAIAMAVIGWNLGGNSREKPAADPPAAASRSSRPERTVRTRPGPSGEAAQRLAAIRNATSPAERMRATIDLANTLPPAEFAAWLNGGWFNLRAGMESTVFARILMERWRQEDGESCYFWCRENDFDLAESILTAWAATEPQRLLDFFKSYPDDRAEIEALGELARKHPELALRRVQEMITAGLSEDDLFQAGYVMRELAEQSPAALEGIIDTLTGSVKVHAEKYLIGRKMRDSFASEVRKLWDRPDGLSLFVKIYDDTSSLHGKLLDELTNLPASWRARIGSNPQEFLEAQDAAKWAAADLEGSGFTAEQAREIRARAVWSMMSQEPAAALRVLLELDLPSGRREGILSSLFSELRKKPEQAEALLALLGSESDREIARNAFQPSQSIKLDIPDIEQPAEWLATVTALDPANQEGFAYLRMLQTWEPEKVAALAAGFHSLSEAKKRDLALFVIRNTSSEDQPLWGEALAHFVAQPPDHPIFEDPFAEPNGGRGASQAIILASKYVTQLGQENPEKAGQWIQTLPEGEAKLYAAKNLQSVWSLYDPEAAERWMKTLPAVTREKVEKLK